MKLKIKVEDRETGVQPHRKPGKLRNFSSSRQQSQDPESRIFCTCHTALSQALQTSIMSSSHVMMVFAKESKNVS